MNRISLGLGMFALMVACGPPGGGDDGDGDGDGASSPGTNSSTSNTTQTPPTSGQNDGSGDSNSGSGTTSGGSTTSSVEDDGPGSTTSPGIKLDQGIIPDAPMFCEQGKGEVEFSYIWVANSTQSTISKINTQTLTEEGRYYTKPDLAGSPSRTSVSLTGNVATANRNGGLTKFYARPENCNDNNGNGSIQTSSGAADILPWGDDECMAWHTPMAYASQRPVAWTQGEFDEAACATINEKVWTSGANGGAIEVLLVDGDTGVIEQTIPIPGVTSGFYGIYGAAVDSEGNFWGSQLGGGTLVNVDLETFDIQTWPTPAGGYGMTVDHEGFVWTCSSNVARFDPVTETWDQASVGASGGCMADGGDILWMAGSPMRGVNRQTLLVEYSIPLPNYVHGVSVDFEGYVWGVSMNTEAYRADPDAGTWDTVTGLVNPYTYSDMTGFALNNVGGGGVPSG